jgi:hypothetical protein
MDHRGGEPMAKAEKKNFCRILERIREPDLLCDYFERKDKRTKNTRCRQCKHLGPITQKEPTAKKTTKNAECKKKAKENSESKKEPKHC